jgi:uncharacterized protein (DUF952 family)
MSESILHITSRAAWSEAEARGRYTAESLVKEGFIHCSKTGQVIRVANLIYSGQSGLVLLVIDPGRLTSELRWEPGTDLASELFPHVYGPINPEAVVRVVDFAPGPNGQFELPKDLAPAGQ